jgi:alpha-L-fucosidase
MKFKLLTAIALTLAQPGLGFSQDARPLAERQEDFRSWKFGMFIHYGLASFNAGQWATGYEDPGSFAPTQLDCGQWADAAKAAGMKYAVFTTKHTSGYALWDSKHTMHDITAFKDFRQGKGDLVREYVDAFRARDLKIGLYYCLPGDYSKGRLKSGQKDLHGLPPEATGDFVNFIKLQLTELLTQYGQVDLMWFDQYNNKYTKDQWAEIKAHVRSLQPNCLVLANNSTDFSETDIQSYEYPWLKAKNLTALPPEENTNISEVCDCLTPGAWFWQPNVTEKSMRSAEDVVDLLNLCNSRNSNYLLNVAPDRNGLIPEWKVQRLREIGQKWKESKPAE